MATNEPTRAQALAAQTSSISRAGATTRRSRHDESKGRPQPEPEPVALSFDLSQIKNVRLTVSAKGVVIGPPKPKRITVELCFEETDEAPGH